MTEQNGLGRSSATDELRRMLDERGVGTYKHEVPEAVCLAYFDGARWHDCWESTGGEVNVTFSMTPEQAIAATLGRKPWVNPAWERWHRSLRHDEIKSISDAIEQLMYEAIEFGGDMGPNGNTYNGIDEGDVLTAGYINEWVERFENMMGAGTCHPIISDNLAESGSTGDAWADCSECGQLLFVLTDPSSKPPNYCPNCGRKVVDE